MTAAIVIDVVARQPDCDGQAADAASAYTQVQMEGAPRLLSMFEEVLLQFGWENCRIGNVKFVHRKQD